MIDVEKAQDIANDFLKRRTVEWNNYWARYSVRHSLKPDEFEDLEDFVVLENMIFERDFGWAFYAVPRKTFKQIWEPRGWLLLGIFFVVSRDDGSLQELDMSHLDWELPVEEAVSHYEAPFHGFSAERYDLVIHEVHRLQATLDFLQKLTLEYWKPFRVISGVNVMTPHRYRPEQVTKMLLTLPFKFPSQDIRRHFRIFQEMDQRRDCIYELIPLSGEAARHPNYELMKRHREEVDQSE